MACRLKTTTTNYPVHSCGHRTSQHQTARPKGDTTKLRIETRPIGWHWRLLSWRVTPPPCRCHPQPLHKHLSAWSSPDSFLLGSLQNKLPRLRVWCESWEIWEKKQTQNSKYKTKATLLIHKHLLLTCRHHVHVRTWTLTAYKASTTNSNRLYGHSYTKTERHDCYCSFLFFF